MLANVTARLNHVLLKVAVHHLFHPFQQKPLFITREKVIPIPSTRLGIARIPASGTDADKTTGRPLPPAPAGNGASDGPPAALPKMPAHNSPAWRGLENRRGPQGESPCRRGKNDCGPPRKA